MRVRHVSITVRKSPGIRKQMHYEQKAATQLGITWDCKVYSADLSLDRGGSSRSVIWRRLALWLRTKASAYIDVYRHRAEFDGLIIRYSPSDPLMIALMVVLRRPTILVHHTIAASEYGSGGILGKFRMLLERAQLPIACRVATISAAVTPEVAMYVARSSPAGRPSPLIYPNGVLFDHPPLDDRRGAIPTLLVLASEVAPWHGLDLLYADAQAVDTPFLVHVVGPVSDTTMSWAHDPRWRIHGILDPSEIRELAAECWLGLDSLALNRKGMLQACTLKSREYLSMGLPVASGHVDVFPDDFPFYVQIGPSVQMAVATARRFRGLGRDEVVRESRPYIDKVGLLRHFSTQVYNVLCSAEPKGPR